MNPSFFTGIEKDAFISLQGLDTLLLKSLNVSSLNKFKGVPFPRKLDLSDNPLTCNCDLDWLVKMWMSQEMDDREWILPCSTPPELSGRALTSLTGKLNFKCQYFEQKI